MSKESCGVKVLCRFRPFNDREKAEFAGKPQTMKLVCNGGQIKIEHSFNKHEFNFDMAFPPERGQEALYEYIAPSLKDIEEGYNGTIFAYGQTGSGKTFTMFGPDGYEKFPEQWGVIPRACTAIFDTINKAADSHTEYSITGSFLEVYNESIRDLIDPRKDNLMVRESPAKGIYVEDLTQEYLAAPEDVWALIALGDSHKAKASTAMNARSSRSHSVFILQLHQKMADGTTKSGKLNLVDLAGSEKVGKTGATGDVLEQAKNINKSLSALGNCINALTSPKKVHVPYRDSKLTRILQESLGGNCKTTLIICASPHEFNVEETISTLRFGQRAKLIQNTIKANVLRSAEELEKLLAQRTSEYAKLQKYCKGLEDTIAWMKSADYAPGKECPIKLEKPGTQSAAAVSNSNATGGDEDNDESNETNDAQELEEIPDGSFDPLKQATARMDLQKQQTASRDQIEHLNSEVSRLSEKENELMTQITTVQNELAQARVAETAIRQANEAERDQWRADKAKIEFARKQAETKAETAVEELERANAQITQLQSALATAQAAVGTASDAEMQVLRQQLAESGDRLKELQNKLDEQSTTQADLDQECADLHELIGMLEEDAETAKEDAAKAHEDLDKMTALVKEKENTILALTRELEELKTSNRKAIADLNAEIAALRLKLDAATAELAATKLRESEAAKRLVSATAGSISHEEALALRQEKDRLQAAVDAEVAAKKLLAERMESEVAESARRAQEFTKKMGEEHEKRRVLEDEIRGLNTKLDTAVQEKKKLEQQTGADETRIAMAEKQKETLTIQIKEMREVEDELRTRLATAEEAAARAISQGDSETLKVLRVREANLTQENLQLKRDLESKSTKSVAQLRQMEQQAVRMLELEEEISQGRRTNADLRAENNKVKEDYNSLVKDVKERDERIEEMQQHLHALPLRSRAKIFRPMKSANAIANALAAKEEFGQHLLRKTGLSVKQN